MRRSLFLFLLVAPFAVAQDTQFGGLIGRGGLAQLFENSAYHVVAGVEASVRCGGHLGVFGEYNHWTKTGVGTDEPVGLDLAGGGLRIQGTGNRVRPFFDFGLLAGVERNDQIFPLVGTRSHVGGGGMLGFGAAIPLSRHWYVRPFTRIVVLSTPEFGGFGGASAGYRF